MKNKENSIDSRIEAELTDHYQKYYRLAYSYVRNEADAMDIVQEGAYRAIRNSKSLQKEEYLETWLYRIVVNESINYIRKNKRMDCVDLDGCDAGGTDRYEDIDLARAVDGLGEPDRTIIKLRFYEELKLQQIADIIGENLNTVKSRLYRSLKRLRLSLEE